MSVKYDPTSDRRLTEALVRGPFSVALREAVRHRGLSLDRIQARLRDRAVTISRTALSNWQTGHTRPERPDSLRAVQVLEDLLELPTNALMSLLGRPRPRGRRPRRSSFELDQAWARPDGLMRALEGLSMTGDTFNGLTRLALHVTCSVDAKGCLRDSRILVVLRAEIDKIDRYVAAYRTDSRMCDVLPIGDTLGCRTGRQFYESTTGFTVFELLLDRQLKIGECVSVQYSLDLQTRKSEQYYSQRISESMRVYSLQVRFATDALPMLVRHSFLPSVARPKEQEIDLRIGVDFTAQHVVIDPSPGIYRINWDWQ